MNKNQKNDLDASNTSSAKSQENPQDKRNPQKGKKGLKRVYNAFLYSKDGLSAAFKEEEGFRQVCCLAVVCLVCGFYFGDGFSQKIILGMCGTLCVIVELFNSAIENAIDHTSIKPHPFAKKAKDMGSAAQMLSIIFVAIVWGVFIVINIF